jgi:MFS family permease
MDSIGNTLLPKRNVRLNVNDKRSAIACIFLVSNIFVWYFLAIRTIQMALSDIGVDYFYTILIWMVHLAVLILSMLGGAILNRKIDRNLLFVLWVIFGIISPLPLLILDLAKIPIIFMTGILFGFSLGFGMTNCMEYFTRLTKNENRGRFGGIIFFVTTLGLFFLAMLNTLLIGSVALLIFWRSLALVVLLFIKPFNRVNVATSSISFKHVISNRGFILYLIPWIMFSLVNYLSTPVQINELKPDTLNFLVIIGNAAGGFSALAAGFVMDHFGRKPVAITGFALLGISYSLLGLFPAEPSWYIFMVLDGLTWGILTVLFVITLWGDLSKNCSSDYFYALGVLPFFISRFLHIALANSIADSILPIKLFSFIAFFLFLAVLPLVYAPETLAEKSKKDRELKQYIKKAQQISRKRS